MPLNAQRSTLNAPSSLVLLGSTGSIGVNTLIIAKRYNLKIEALVAGSNIDLLNEQIAAFAPKMVAIARQEDRHRVHHDNVFVGEAGILELLERSVSPTIVNALVGYAGMRPTLKAIELGRHVALANKESLVVAGEFIDTSRITPIDTLDGVKIYVLHGWLEPHQAQVFLDLEDAMSTGLKDIQASGQRGR